MSRYKPRRLCVERYRHRLLAIGLYFMWQYVRFYSRVSKSNDKAEHTYTHTYTELILNII